MVEKKVICFWWGWGLVPFGNPNKSVSAPNEFTSKTEWDQSV